jgi:cell division protein ZapA
MEKLRIYPKIVGKEYPMLIDPADEFIIRKAADSVSTSVKEFMAKHPKLDVQDALAVVAFNCLVREMKAEFLYENTEAEANIRLQRINNMLSSAL